MVYTAEEETPNSRNHPNVGTSGCKLLPTYRDIWGAAGATMRVPSGPRDGGGQGSRDKVPDPTLGSGAPHLVLRPGPALAFRGTHWGPSPSSCVSDKPDSPGEVWKASPTVQMASGGLNVRGSS